MLDDLDEEYQKSSRMAAGHFRKVVSGFRQRRGLELEDLLPWWASPDQGLRCALARSYLRPGASSGAEIRTALTMKAKRLAPVFR